MNKVRGRNTCGYLGTVIVLLTREWACEGAWLANTQEIGRFQSSEHSGDFWGWALACALGIQR